ASAGPIACPGNQSSSTAAAELSHGIVTALPDWTTTTVCGLAAVIADTRSFWTPGRSMLFRSLPSPLVLATNTTATLAALAAATAAGSVGAPGGCQPRCRWESPPAW